MPPIVQRKALLVAGAVASITLPGQPTLHAPIEGTFTALAIPRDFRESQAPPTLVESASSTGELSIDDLKLPEPDIANQLLSQPERGKELAGLLIIDRLKLIIRYSPRLPA